MSYFKAPGHFLPYSYRNPGSERNVRNVRNVCDGEPPRGPAGRSCFRLWRNIEESPGKRTCHRVPHSTLPPLCRFTHPRTNQTADLPLSDTAIIPAAWPPTCHTYWERLRRCYGFNTAFKRRTKEGAAWCHSLIKQLIFSYRRQNISVWQCLMTSFMVGVVRLTHNRSWGYLSSCPRANRFITVITVYFTTNIS